MTWPPTECRHRPIHRRRYPGLGHHDAAVLRTAIARRVVDPDELWLDVPLGDLPDWVATAPAHSLAAQQARIYYRRCDAVMRIGPQFWLVEIKPTANPTAIGQLCLYRYHAHKLPEPASLARCCILCHYADPDVIAAAATLSIDVCSLNAPTPQPFFQAKDAQKPTPPRG